MAIVTLTPTVLSGLGVPYALEADRDASTLGEYGPQAGYPEPQEDTLGRRPAMALSATGEQTSTTSLEITTQAPGNIGRATFRLRRTIAGAVDAKWTGADQPNVLTGAHLQWWADSSNEGEPHAVVLPDDSVVLVYYYGTGGFLAVASQVYDPATDTYSSVVDVRTGLDTRTAISPALCLIPDPGGSSNPIILCAYWSVDYGNDEAQIDVSASRDGGLTWSIWSRSVLPEPIGINGATPDFVLGRIRWTYLGGQVVLFAHTTGEFDNPYYPDSILQYASGDLGASFELVGRIENSDGLVYAYGYPDVVTVGAVAWLAYIAYSTGPNINVYMQPVRSAWVLARTISSGQAGLFATESMAVVTSVVPLQLSFASMAIAAQPDGKIAVMAIQADGTTKEGCTALYDPATQTATELTSSAQRWWYDLRATSTEYTDDLCAVAYRGQIRLHATMITGGTDYDDRITRLDLGGQSNVTMPTRTAAVGATFRYTSIPTRLMSSYYATFTGAGTRSVTTNAGWETLTTVANTAYYTYSQTCTADQEIWQLWRVKVDSGGSVGGRNIACGIRVAGVGYGFECDARFSTTQIRLYDVNAAATIATVTIDTSTVGVDVLMAVSGAGKVSAWIRVFSSNDLRSWTTLYETYSLTDDAGAGGTTGVTMWGHRATATATSRWIVLAGIGGASTAGELATAPSNPTDLRGIPFSRASYAAAGVTIGAVGGPALAGDAWVIRPDAEHPVRYALPVGDTDSARNVIGGQRTSSQESASAWWSTATTGYLAVRFADAANRTHPALLAIHVEGLNAPEPTIYGYNYDTPGRTSFGTLGNLVSGLRFSRPSASSATVRVETAGASTSEPYCRAGSLKGSYFRFSAGGKVRPILDNTEGRWSDDGDAANVILTLGGIDGTEPTSGSGGALIYSRATFVIAMPASTEYGRFELYWGSAPDIYEAQIRCSIFAVCPVEPLLHARTWGTAYKVEDPAELTEARSGLRRGRRVRVAPRRSLNLPLTMLWNQRPIAAPSAENPMVYKAYNNAGHPLAGVRGDEFGKLLGAWRRAGGSQHPVLWLPRIATASTQTLIGDAAGFYCRVTSPPQFTDDYGSDTGSAYADFVRGDNWTLEEEI